MKLSYVFVSVYFILFIAISVKCLFEVREPLVWIKLNKPVSSKDRLVIYRLEMKSLCDEPLTDLNDTFHEKIHLWCNLKMNETLSILEQVCSANDETGNELLSESDHQNFDNFFKTSALNFEFSDLGNAISDFEYATIHKKFIPKNFLRIFNITLDHLDYSLDFASLESCSLKKMNFYIKFRVHKIDKNIEIRQQDAFRLHHEDANCYIKYTGPELVFYDKSYDAFCPILDPKSILARSVINFYKCPLMNGSSIFDYGVECLQRALYEQELVQIKTVGHEYLVYCYGGKLKFRNRIYDCPKNVFALPFAERFLKDYKNRKVKMIQMVSTLSLTDL